MTAWAGKVALVTGASSGIGRATAKRLAEVGMKVVVCARRKEALDELVGSVDGDIAAYAVDLRDEQQIRDLFATTKERFGGVDVLVNNAGLGHDAPLMSGETAHWREMLEVNVLALCVCTREAVQDMQARGVAGHVIHVSSMAAHRVPRGSGVYSATKFAVRSLTEGLRQELRAANSPIRVTAISPGYVETEFAARYHKSEEAAKKTYSRFPVLQSEDIAEAVVYVLSQPAHVQVHDVLMRPTDQPT
ncbi:MAG TPA: SDR family NAD(P)-dependent oxidoreductase [Polyangiaceae bacterium]|nr:SDR family NAD(P)-dependent oxidoreductase [Polyangiaceae bacterium]